MAEKQDNWSAENERAAIMAAQKDAQHFSVLYDRYYELIFRMVYKRIGNKDTTADITSQVFLKALINLKKYKITGAPFSAWLVRIGLNEVNMYFRKSKKVIEVEISEREISALMDEADIGFKEEDYEMVIEAMNELPEEQNQLIELRFFEKYSFKEMGTVLNLTEANAKMKLYRTLEKVKKVITLKRLRKG